MSHVKRLMKVHPYAVLISAELSTETLEDNITNTVNLHKSISFLGLPFREAQGMYRGTTECSFIVFCHDIFDVLRMEAIGIHQYKQESILVLDLERETAILKYEFMAVMIGKRFTICHKPEYLTAYTIIDDETWMVS